ncbi:MAG: hypothetical protein ABJA67_13980 [Chthonomonadales bacterium]
MSGLQVPPLWAAIAGATWLLFLSLTVLPFLRRLGMVRPNFRGESIPVGAGMLIALWSTPIFLILAAQHHGEENTPLAFAVIIAVMALLGFVDDKCGDRTATGLKGHFLALVKSHRITTGLVKASGGLGLSIAVCKVLMHDTWGIAVIDGALVALSANAINLFDLRPGRAGAVFLVSGIGLTLAGVQELIWIIVPAAVVQERDSRAKAMLGDTGSNLLGGSLGLALVAHWPNPMMHAVVLIGIIALHVITERWSITQIIEKNIILSRLDSLTGVRKTSITD